MQTKKSTSLEHVVYVFLSIVAHGTRQHFKGKTYLVRQPG
jgi:hypothetical protein